MKNSFAFWCQTSAPSGSKYKYGFYFVVAPDVDKLNKFYWK